MREENQAEVKSEKEIVTALTDRDFPTCRV